jgi:glycosyltransferase involved in cell wall biosynthesis
VYDLCHRDRPEFPEVAERYEFESRETSLRESLPRALAVLVSSTSLGEKITRYYGVDKARIIVLPFIPAPHARQPADEMELRRVRQRYSLPPDYIFYPAQFWPHKNHVYLLHGLQILQRDTGIRLHAVFCGTDFGSETHVRKTAELLGLTDNVHFLGFVDSADICGLYSGARALVMPTYFGPTNIPPLEAMATQCPVIYSDLPEFREELGDAALYCDLRDPGSLTEQLNVILTRPEIVGALRKAGQAKLASTRPDTYSKRLQILFDELAYTRQRLPPPT